MTALYPHMERVRVFADKEPASLSRKTDASGCGKLIPDGIRWWCVSLRGRICYLLARLRIHSPDCEHCNTRETCWGEMRERFEQLNWRTQPRSLKNGDQGEVAEVLDSKLPKL